MRKVCLFFAIVCMMVGCRQESMVDRAAREAKEYTERMCPTPVYNDTRTDSVTFNKASKTYTYHCSFLNLLDDSTAINRIKDKLHQQLLVALIQNTGIKAYKDADFNFEYICRSAKNPHQILYKDLFKANQINKAGN